MHRITAVRNRMLITALVLLLVSSCAPFQPDRPIRLPPEAPPTAPVEPPAAPVEPPTVPVRPPVPPAKPLTGPAAPLYTEAETALQAGNYAAAEMLLERALRIEPRNPLYWYALARTAYHQGDYQQTIQFCRKADSLVGANRQLATRNRELLDQAQQKARQSQ